MTNEREIFNADLHSPVCNGYLAIQIFPCSLRENVFIIMLFHMFKKSIFGFILLSLFCAA